MGSVNKQSVREEVERIKTEFERLSADKKVNAETKMLFQSMFMIINLILSIFLEKTTKKDNKNSSKPSSQTEKDESSLSKEGAKGKGKQESNTTAYNTRTVETIEVVQVTQCDICGNDLSKVPCQHIERRTKIDIIFEKVVEHVDAEVKYCTDCDATVKGKFPADMPGPLQYGNGLWASNMKALLLETCKKVSQRKRKKISESEYANLQKRYRNIITRGEKELPAIPPKVNGKRGKIAKSDAHNLWERLKDHESAVLLYAIDPHVSFTNNRAERDLRMSKVKQKVSGCFRKELYAKAYCRISSYLQTMANKGINPLIAIQMALAGKLD